MTGKSIKDTNTSNILKTIWVSKGISRIDISKKLNIDKSTVTVIVSDLISKRIVYEEQFLNAGPRGGRKPVILKMDKKFGYISGIEIHHNSYRAVLINFEGDIVHSFHQNLTINSENLKTTIYNGPINMDKNFSLIV